jgi:hypothetical protein
LNLTNLSIGLFGLSVLFLFLDKIVHVDAISRINAAIADWAASALADINRGQTGTLVAVFGILGAIALAYFFLEPVDECLSTRLSNVVAPTWSKITEFPNSFTIPVTPNLFCRFVLQLGDFAGNVPLIMVSRYWPVVLAAIGLVFLTLVASALYVICRWFPAGLWGFIGIMIEFIGLFY